MGWIKPFQFSWAEGSAGSPCTLRPAFRSGHHWTLRLKRFHRQRTTMFKVEQKAMQGTPCSFVLDIVVSLLLTVLEALLASGVHPNVIRLLESFEVA